MNNKLMTKKSIQINYCCKYKSFDGMTFIVPAALGSVSDAIPPLEEMQKIANNTGLRIKYLYDISKKRKHLGQKKCFEVNESFPLLFNKKTAKTSN